MNHPRNSINRLLSLLLILCLMAGLVPAAAADSAWAEKEMPYSAKLKAGTLFYTDEELKEPLGILEKDAMVRVAEAKNRAARINYTVKQQTETAWVDGDGLILVDVATPTDLDALVKDEDVSLLPPAAEEEPEEQPEEDPEEDPEAEPGPAAEEPDASEEAEAGEEPEAAEEPETVEEPETAEENPAGTGSLDEDGEPAEEYNAFGSLSEEEDPEPEGKQVDTPDETDETGDDGSTFTLTGDGKLADSAYATSNLPANRNQGAYGTCWAHAAVGAMEIFLIKNGWTTNSINLSEYFLAYYGYHNYPYPKVPSADNITTDNRTYLDNGGGDSLASYILSALIGTTQESVNPYPSNSYSSDHSAVNAPVSVTSIVAQITGALYVSPSNRDGIKDLIKKYGAVTAGVKTSVGSTKYLNNGVCYCPEKINAGHAVLLVGWNDTYPRGNFTANGNGTPPGDGAWKVRNSWGSGSDFWLSYYDQVYLNDECYAYTAAYDIEGNGSRIDDYCYTYAKTPFPLYSVYPKPKGQAVVEQSFTVDANEIIRAVGIDMDANIKAAWADIIVDGNSIGTTYNYPRANSGFCRMEMIKPYTVSGRKKVTVKVIYQTESSSQEINVRYQRNNDNSRGYTSYVDSDGFTVNGTKVNGDSTIRLYTERASSTGLATQVSMSPTSLSLSTGTSAKLTATVYPDSATNRTLSWSSSDNNIAAVDSTGRVVGGIKAGKAYITAMTSNGKYARCTVTNTAGSVSLSLKSKYFSAGTSSFTFNQTTSPGLNYGSTVELTAVTTPSGLIGQDIEWTTSNSNVISIEKSKSGTAVIKLNQNGSARITARSRLSPYTVTASVTLTVNLTIPVQSISLSHTSVTLKEGDTVKLTATISPANATNKRYTLTTSNASVAGFTSDGLLKGVKYGTAVITAKSDDGGKTATCTVTVEPKDPVVAFVVRMYRVCLFREADASGLNNWVNQLKRHVKTGSEVAYSFYNSPEMINRNLSNGDFIERCYAGLMGRASDAGGKQSWINKLNSGFSRKYVISGFVRSREFAAICAQYGITVGVYRSNEARDQNEGITGFVTRLYTKLLGRSYDPSGLNSWCQKILARPTKATMLNVALSGFIHSREFQNKRLSNAEYVKVLYRTFLNREADGAGLLNWQRKLQAGMSRDTVAAQFANSQEFARILKSYGF